MRYLYTQIAPRSPHRPYLSVFLRHGFATTDPTFGLLDSGSDHSLFPYAFAKLLKIDLSDAKIWNFAGTTGQPQIAYLVKIEINVLSADHSQTEFTISTDAGFCPDLEFPGVLLGQHGFFSHFKIAFHQPYDFFEIEPF